MSDYFEIAGDMSVVHHKLGILGDSGDGKTFTAVMAAEDVGKDPLTESFVGDPGVAVLACEHQARQTIRVANPQARVKIVENGIDDVREFVRMAADGEFAAMGITRLVLDSLTEIQRLIKDAIMEENQDDDFYRDDWGTLANRDRNLLRTIRALPYNVVCTILAEEKEDERRKQIIVKPMFEGRKTPQQVAQFFEAIGIMSRRKVRGEKGRTHYEYRTLFEAPERYRCVKGVVPLVGAQPACAGYWLDLLDGKIEAAPLEEVEDHYEKQAREEREAAKKRAESKKRRGRRRKDDDGDSEEG